MVHRPEWAREAPGHDHGAAQQTRGTHCSPSLGRTRGDSHMPCCSPLRPERPAHCPSHCSSLHPRRRGDSWRSVAASPANAVSQPGRFQKGPLPQRCWEWRCHGNEAAVSGLALTEQVYPDIQQTAACPHPTPPSLFRTRLPRGRVFLRSAMGTRQSPSHPFRAARPAARSDRGCHEPTLNPAPPTLRQTAPC